MIRNARAAAGAQVPQDIDPPQQRVSRDLRLAIA